MDDQVIRDAAIYAKIKAGSLAYYHANAEEISARRKQLWRLAHPNPRPRGRPRKATAEIYEKGVGGVVETDSGNVSSSSSEAV